TSPCGIHFEKLLTTTKQGKLASIEELEPFVKRASQMVALDCIVSIESDVFIPSYSRNMASAVEGHLMLR
ncbi:hypothetical protein CUMW_154490, partial [Citrus unshiu]